MFLTEAELTYKCGILLNIGDVMGVQGPLLAVSIKPIAISQMI